MWIIPDGLIPDAQTYSFFLPLYFIIFSAIASAQKNSFTILSMQNFEVF